MSIRLNQIKAYASKRNIPLIPIQASSVSIINEPRLFYKYICDRIKTINTRLALSALYLGTGDKEMTLVQMIHDRIKQRKGLKVNLVMDINRANRKDEEGRSSVTTLGDLSNLYNVKLNLVETNPSNFRISSIFAKIRKFNEILSTYHSKILVFDNDVVVTGANLSDSYFDSRQDRYIVIGESEPLSNYLFQLLDKINEPSKSIRSVIRKHNTEYINLTNEDSDTYVIPLNQHGPSNLDDIEDFLKFLNLNLPEEARVYMSTGYFNPSPTINQMRICSVLAPSEASNGFFEGGGLLKYIPRIYSAIQKLYIHTHNQCRLFLYNKQGWTFHAKGIWVEGLEDLHINLIGSSNFNCRSSKRDFETQLAILTNNKDLIDKLKAERVALWKDTVQASAFEISPIFESLARWFKNYL